MLVGEIWGICVIMCCCSVMKLSYLCSNWLSVIGLGGPGWLLDIGERMGVASV